MKERKDLMDVYKLIASVLIVIIHLDFKDEIKIVSYFFGRIGVPIFFVSAGYWYYRKLQTNNHRLYLKNTLNQYVYLFVLYLPIGIYQLNTMDVSVDIQTLGDQIWQFIMVLTNYGSSYQLWYFPALIFSLCLMTIFTKKNLNFGPLAIGLYILGSLETYYYILPPNIQDFMNIYFRWFTTTRNGLFFGLVFVMMGCHISRDKPQVMDLTKKVFLSLGLLFVEVLFVRHTGSARDYNHYLALLPVVYYFFLWIKDIKVSFTTGHLDKLSKHFYLCHVAVIGILPFILSSLGLNHMWDDLSFRIVSVISMCLFTWDNYYLQFYRASLRVIKLWFTSKISDILATNS